MAASEDISAGDMPFQMIFYNGNTVYRVALEEYKAAAGDSASRSSRAARCEGDTLVAIHTSHKSGRQNQSIACSVDRGRTFPRYEHNPVPDM